MYIYTLEIDRNICDINSAANVWNETPFSSHKKALAQIEYIQSQGSNVFHLSSKLTGLTSWYDEFGNRMAIQRSKVY